MSCRRSEILKMILFFTSFMCAFKRCIIRSVSVVGSHPLLGKWDAKRTSCVLTAKEDALNYVVLRWGELILHPKIELIEFLRNMQ